MMAATALALVGAGCGSDDDTSSSTSAATSASTAAATSTPDTTAQTSEASGSQIQSNPDNSATSITVGSKNFTEQKILGEVYAQALQAAGYEVKTELNLGDEKTALKALKDGQIDAYPEYTGTALLSSSEPQPAPTRARAVAAIMAARVVRLISWCLLRAGGRCGSHGEP
jgi:glycine betaine/choline ABC-type transport system substrate-binding protein